MRRTIVYVATCIVIVGLVGTASASFVMTSVNQIAPSVRARLSGVNGKYVTTRRVRVCGDGTCHAAAFAVAQCPSGTVPVGGGFFEGPHRFLATLAQSDAVSNTRTGRGGWGVILADIEHTNGTFRVQATCLKAGSAAAQDIGAARPTSASDMAAATAALNRRLRYDAVAR